VVGSVATARVALPDVATSRTGTATYLRNRKRALHAAKSAGLTHCPGYEDTAGTHRPCGRELDYETPLLDESAETDHIIEHRYGGTDALSNLRVLCRACNRERNHDRVPVPVSDPDDFPLSRDWLAPGGGTPTPRPTSPPPA
jgi:5-methylcytosine-specific restriction endonuclease McrA